MYALARSPSQCPISGRKGQDMKLFRMFATAGLVVASLGVSTAASARDHHGDRDWGRHERHDRGWHGRDWRHHDNGHHYGWGHNRCHTEWRHHRAVRVCR
jgi:hypothetical protein